MTEKENDFGIYLHLSNYDFRALGIRWKLEEDIIVGAKRVIEGVSTTTYTKEEVYEFLWKLGIDTKRSKPKLTPIHAHRNKDGKIVVDNRIMGYERLDRGWVKSGKASDDAFFASSHMKDMVEVIGKMKRGG